MNFEKLSYSTRDTARADFKIRAVFRPKRGVKIVELKNPFNPVGLDIEPTSHPNFIKKFEKKSAGL